MNTIWSTLFLSFLDDGCCYRYCKNWRKKIQIAVWIKYKLILNKFLSFSLALCPTFLHLSIYELVGWEGKKSLKVLNFTTHTYMFARSTIKMITAIWEKCRMISLFAIFFLFILLENSMFSQYFLLRAYICSLQSISICGEI